MHMGKIIGIVGGVGPYAGADLVMKILSQTDSTTDQGHLPLIMLSMPELIEDRTAFLSGKSKINPALAIASIISRLEQAGAEIIGIPCNSVHAPEIFGVILETLRKINCRVRLVNMINEVAEFISCNYPDLVNIGVLASTGLYITEEYTRALVLKGYNVIVPSIEIQNELVHKSIYDHSYGIKAHAYPPTEKARENLKQAICHLQKNGAEAVVLGCTEMCLAIRERTVGKCIIFDSAMILARALIKLSDPSKLKQWDKNG